MSYIKFVQSQRPVQYYTISGPSGAYDISGRGATSLSSYQSLSAVGLIAGQTLGSAVGGTAPNSANIMSINGGNNPFTIDFWCNPGAGYDSDAGLDLRVPLVTAPNSQSGVYYYKDRFRFWISDVSIPSDIYIDNYVDIYGGTGIMTTNKIYYTDFFAPEYDDRYHVAAVYVSGAIYLVVNGIPGDTITMSNNFSFKVAENYLTIGAKQVTNLAIFDSAHSLDKIRERTNEGFYAHNFQEHVVADKGHLWAFDQSDIVYVVDEKIDTEKFSLANHENTRIDEFGRLTIIDAPTIYSGPTAPDYTGNAFNFSGGKYVKVSDIYTVMANSQSAFGAQFLSPTGAHALITIDTPSRGKTWDFFVNSSQKVGVKTTVVSPDNSTVTGSYLWDTAIATGTYNNIVFVADSAGIVLHSARPGAGDGLINTYSGATAMPVVLEIDQSSIMYLGQDTTFAATPPTSARALMISNRVLDTYSSNFASMMTDAPAVIYPLTKNLNPQQYGEMTLTTMLGASGPMYDSIVDYKHFDAFKDITSMSGVVAYYDARWVNGLTGSAPATGAAISQWKDLSPAGFHLAQGTTGKRPTYSPTGSNGGPGIVFDAASSQELVYTSASFTGAKPGWTVYAVVAATGVTSASNQSFAYVSTNSNVDTLMGLAGKATTAELRVSTAKVDADTTYTMDRGIIPNNAMSIFSGSVNFSTAAVGGTINGIEFGATASWATGASQAAGNIAVGSTVGAAYLNGTVAAVAIFGTYHDDDTRRAVEGTLSMIYDCPAPKSNGLAIKYSSNQYYPVRRYRSIPLLGPTGSIGTTLSDGPVVVKAALSTYNADDWVPLFESGSIKVAGTTGIDSRNCSDSATVQYYGLALGEKYRDPQIASKKSGVTFYSGGQLTLPSDTIYAYELIVNPGNNIGTGEILCINPGTHYALTLTGLTLTSTGFATVYVNGAVLGGSATLVANANNHIIAVSGASLASPAYINGHATGTLRNSNVTVHSYAQYNYALGATAAARHYSAAVGLVSQSVTDTEQYNIAENASYSVYSYAWQGTSSSQN